MPRSLDGEYINSDMGDFYNDCITTTDGICHTATQEERTIQNLTQECLISPVVPSSAITTYSDSHGVDEGDDTQEIVHKTQEQQIHTISSSDDEYVLEQNAIEEEIPNISSDENSDFEGFDDCTTPNSSGVINDTSREDFNIYCNYVKRSQTDFNEYHEDSEVTADAVPVDDDEDEEIAIGEDGKIIYNSVELISPKRPQTYRCEPYTPNKRKKYLNVENYITNSTTQLKTPAEQIVEVNSDSTTNSLKEKRQLINNKLQLSLSQQEHHKANNNPNRCSTESTSEFPVSSPSNPQQARGGKYPARPPLLKNTLPADSFERQLAMITSCNPQMTLAEKILTWDCEEEPSDLEDVQIFDEEFKRLEQLKIKQKEKCGHVKNTEYKNYDFLTFRQMILNNIKEQKHQKFNASAGGGGGGASGGKCVETSGSESSKSVVHVDDRPSTSAVAQQQLQQRRSKHQLCFEPGEPKKRVMKKSQNNQNSTSPPQTSSSDNERDCFKSSKNNLGQSQIHTYDTLLCESSSEEVTSQDGPAHVPSKTNNKYSQFAVRNVRKKSPVRHQPPHQLSKSNEKNKLPKNSRIITDEEIQSFFRPHRLNRERDKYNRPSLNEVEEQSTSIIQMRLDYTNENKREQMFEKKQELFKTPIIPQKYLANPFMTAEYQTQNNCSPTKNEKSDEEKATDPLKAHVAAQKADLGTNEALQDKLAVKSTVDDIDGVYHQQHEFCNYLGLTGMSTATAMANAVAELAQCNLARRSMRVLRQQQQERRDKSAKQERLSEALKVKELKEIRKREKDSCDITTVIETVEQSSVLKSEEGSHSQASEPETSLKELNKKNSNKSKAKSSTKSRKSYKVKKEPEIKILCHIAAKEEAEKISSECIEEISIPIKETLIHEAKQCKSDKPADVLENTNEIKNNAEINLVEKENTGRILTLPILSAGKSVTEKEKVTKILRSRALSTEKSMVEKDNLSKVLRSPILSPSKYLLKNSRIGSQILYEQKNTVQSKETSIACKFETVCDTESVSKSIDNKCVSPTFKTEDLETVQIFNEHFNGEERRLCNLGINFISSTPKAIQKKLQLALEESRKSKPSIFIVQSLESKKENVSNTNMSAFLPKVVNSATSSPEKYKSQDMYNDFVKPLIAPLKKYKNNDNKRKVFKKIKGKKYPISKRKLRKRKIIVIKSLKPKHKSYESLNISKRELRSSPRINENQRQNSLLKKNEKVKQNSKSDKIPAVNEAKSFRTVHTETKDLEIYLNKSNNQTKTRLMAKASALLERSRRMTLRGSYNVVNTNSKRTSKIQRSKLNLHGNTTETFKTKVGKNTSQRKKNRTTSKTQRFPLAEQKIRKPITTIGNISTTSNMLESENVVVSSTTNTYDEKPSYEPLPTQSPIILRSNNTAPYVVASSQIKTKDRQTQCSISNGVHYLNTPPLPIQAMRNPLKSEHGVVLYIYNELDILIVIQEHLVSFWKCSKLINMLLAPSKLAACSQPTLQHSETTLLQQSGVENSCNNLLGYPALSSTLNEPNDCNEWIQLGELRRLNLDFEISVPYGNRICLHNSTPIYLEMRAKQLPKNQRECNLISMYINIYYYHDEDMIAKCHSIPLDSIQSDITSVNYTTLTDSRYFIITWPQENLLGKTRSGLCKYSLTPQLDTLASIREFKSMRHTIRYLECMSDDKLIGFGDTQVSIWDYRSGDVLMNFDFEIPMGRNLGSVYFASQDIEHNNVLILHQFRDLHNNGQTELMTLACTVTHNQPSYKVLQETNLPMPAFKVIKSAIKTVDHLVIAGQNDDELWISLANPRLMTVIPNIQNSKRFYCRERSQLIELTEKTLNVNSLANYIFQLAAGFVLH